MDYFSHKYIPLLIILFDVEYGCYELQAKGSRNTMSNSIAFEASCPGDGIHRYLLPFLTIYLPMLLNLANLLAPFLLF